MPEAAGHDGTLVTAPPGPGDQRPAPVRQAVRPPPPRPPAQRASRPARWPTRPRSRPAREPGGPPLAAARPRTARAAARRCSACRPAVQPSAPAQPSAEKCELCATEVPAEHGHVADLERCDPGVHVPGLLPAVHPARARAAAATGRCPTGTWPIPAAALGAAEWDALQIPVGLAFFLPQLDLGPGRRLLSEPGRGHRVRARPGRVGSGWPRSTRCSARRTPDVEAALICRTDSGVEYFLVPIDVCYELVGRMRLHWRGFDGGAEARASIADFLGHGAIPARAAPWPGGRDRGRLVFDCIGARADPYAAVPAMTLSCGSARRPAQRVDAIALRCQIRIEPARRRYSPAEAERLSDLFGETQRWADTLKPVQFTNVSRHGPGLHRQHRGGPAGPAVRTTWRSARPGTSPAWTTARSRCCCCSAARSSARPTAGCRSSRCRGARRPPTGCRWRCGGRRSTRTSRTAPGSRSAPHTLDELQRFKTRTPCRPGRPPCWRCWPEDAGRSSRQTVQRPGPSSTPSTWRTRAGSPTRSCTRATCCTPTGSRRRRTRSGSSSAC